MGREGYVVPVDPQMGLSVGLKKKPAGSRSWILLDSPGQATVLDLDKYAIMHRVQIHARDLRILDPLLSYPSTILGREKAIVLNLEYIKAIITADEDQTKELIGTGTRRDGLFYFSKTDLVHHVSVANSELELWHRRMGHPSEKVISSWNLDRVRKLKSAMTRLTARVQKVRDELEQLLDDDGDMADLYLSRKLAAPASPVSGSGANWFPSSPTVISKVSRASRASMVTGRGDENDVEELEMLLEAYFMQIDGTLNKLTTLREYIDDTEDYINIQLNNYRNQLIQLELFLSSGTVCLSIYSLVAAIFGMNIPYTWMDNHDYIFKWVIILSGLFSAVFFVVIVAYARFKGLVGS